MSFPLVAFAGSRSLPSSLFPRVKACVEAVVANGRVVISGCSIGADSVALAAALATPLVSPPVCFAIGALSPFVQGFWSGSAPASLISRCSVVHLAGGPLSLPLRVRLARRTITMVHAAAAAPRPGSAVVVFLHASSVGSLLCCRAAAAAGLPVLALPFGPAPLPPLTPGGLWSPVAAASSSPWFGFFRWSSPS